MINHFEQPVLKKMFAPSRARLGIRGRRRKGSQPRTHFEMGVFDKPPDQGGQKVDTVTVPAAEHPLGFIGLKMRAPTFLEPAIPGVPSWEFWTQIEQDSIKRLIPEGHALHIGHLNPMLFARLLAKIGYGYAVATYGYATFLSLVHPLLQGTAAEFSDVIGGDYEVP
jgi:hypothetical protein